MSQRVMRCPSRYKVSTYDLKSKVSLEVDHELPSEVSLIPFDIISLALESSPLPLSELSPSSDNNGRLIIFSEGGNVGRGDGSPEELVDDLQASKEDRTH